MRMLPSGCALIAVAILAAAFGVAIVEPAPAATYVKVADEWGTIQPGGPRSSVNGLRFWNIEGGGIADFASSGTLRFYMEDLVTQLDADFPGGWKIDNITMVAEHFEAAFSAAGNVSIFHFTNDALAITSGMDLDVTDLPPGNFSSLGVSPLVYSDLATADGQPVRMQDMGGSDSDLGTVTRVNDYAFTLQGNSNLDVFGTAASLVDPSGATNLAPDYDLSFPTVNPDDSLVTFASEIVIDGGEWADGAADLLIADISDGTDPLSFVFAPTEEGSLVTATYKGSTFDPEYAPRIYIEASAADGGECTLVGDFSCNGGVENADLTLLLNNWAQPATPVPDGWIGLPQPTDPAIDNDELTALLNNWGASAEAGHAEFSASAPEPGCVTLVMIGLVGLALGRCHSNR